MKKLFTLCATALFALTLSAQVEQTEGSWYLGTGDATTLLNLFSTGVEVTADIGYAVKDNMVIGGSVTPGLENGDNQWGISGYYFAKGFGFGLHVYDVTEVLGERYMSLSVGKMVMLESISDKMYLYPNIQIDEDQNMLSGIGFGMKF